jgi:hypothetical protein
LESSAACFCPKPKLFATYAIIIDFSLSAVKEINCPCPLSLFNLPSIAGRVEGPGMKAELAATEEETSQH